MHPASIGNIVYNEIELAPCSGGVGPVTVSILMRNTVIAAKRQRAHYESEFGQTGAALPGGAPRP